MRNLTKIVPRNIAFGRGQPQDRWWLGGDPVATALYNSMSAIFPKAEAFLIDSVRPFRKDLPADLAEPVNGFMAQESVHSREHVAFNNRVADAGYDLAKLEQRIDERIAYFRRGSAFDCLNCTVVSEHMTAILAHEVLSNPRHMKGASDEARRMWEWHCMEEIEHKAAVFDAWAYLTRDWSPLKRWWSRSWMMLIVTRNFVVDRGAGISELLRQDGQRNFRNWVRLFWYLMVDPGLGRRTTWLWLRWFTPGFHPWKHDDRHLLARFDAHADAPHGQEPAAA